METTSQQMDEMDACGGSSAPPVAAAIARRTQSDLGGEAVIAAALNGGPVMVHSFRPHHYDDDYDNDTDQVDNVAAAAARDKYGFIGIGLGHHSPLSSAMTAASRKLTRHLAKAQLRRSASQPVVVFVAAATASAQQQQQSSLSSTPASSSQQLDSAQVADRTRLGYNAAIATSDEDAGLCLSEDDDDNDNLSEDDILTDYVVITTDAQRQQLEQKKRREGKKSGGTAAAVSVRHRYNAATEGVLAIALWDHKAVEAEELSLKAGDIVHVLDLSDPDWWWAARSINDGQQQQQQQQHQLQLHEQMLYG